MASATMYFKRVPVSQNKKQPWISIRDFYGKEIFGKPKLKNGNLETNMLQDMGDKAMVLLPKGMETDIAIVDINSIYLN